MSGSSMACGPDVWSIRRVMLVQKVLNSALFIQALSMIHSSGEDWVVHPWDALHVFPCWWRLSQLLPRCWAHAGDTEIFGSEMDNASKQLTSWSNWSSPVPMVVRELLELVKWLEKKFPCFIILGIRKHKNHGSKPHVRKFSSGPEANQSCTTEQESFNVRAEGKISKNAIQHWIACPFCPNINCKSNATLVACANIWLKDCDAIWWLLKELLQFSNACRTVSSFIFSVSDASADSYRADGALE